jgi:hypothetical protein
VTPGSLSDRLLQAWERGRGRPLAERAACALRVMPEHEQTIPATLFERDAALLRLRIALHGPLADAVVDCPVCGSEFDVPVDLDRIESRAVAAAAVSVTVDGFSAVVRPPASDDLSGFDGLDAPALADALFRRCVAQATFHGEPVAVSALPGSVRLAASRALSERGMESPAADLICGTCGADWRAPIDIARMVLRDIDAWVNRQLDDVHRIASAYHWSEREILALSPARRQFYLEAIG